MKLGKLIRRLQEGETVAIYFDATSKWDGDGTIVYEGKVGNMTIADFRESEEYCVTAIKAGLSDEEKKPYICILVKVV